MAQTQSNTASQGIADLRARFAIPGVTIGPGEGGLTRVTVTTPLAEGQVYLQGAHVTHFQPSGRGPVLFMSAASHFAPGKPIRGGVPVIFPWFGAKADEPKAPQHGFARTQVWALREVKADADGTVRVVLGLTPSDASRAFWAHAFETLYTVSFGTFLTMTLEVRNTGPAPFRFEEALHTYLAVGDVRTVGIDGLGGRTFIDKVDGAKRKVQPPGPFGITGETDRVYLDTPDTVSVQDHSAPGGGRILGVSKTGSASTVVWNPWTAKAKAMADFGDDEWPNMLCIETANAADNAVLIGAGQNHVLTATVTEG